MMPLVRVLVLLLLLGLQVTYCHSQRTADGEMCKVCVAALLGGCGGSGVGEGGGAVGVTEQRRVPRAVAPAGHHSYTAAC
jgi:hypothetical protein